MSLCYDFQKLTMITLAAVAISLTVGLVLTQYAHGQEWNTTQQNVGALENFTRTAQNGTQYTCQEGSAGKVIGCSPIQVVHGQERNTMKQKQQSNAQSDFNLVANVKFYDINTTRIMGLLNITNFGIPGNSERGLLNITKFEIQGISNSYLDMCPSLQCKVDYKDKDTDFSPPNIPEDMLISSNVDFRLEDNTTRADLGPKKKELVEQYGVDIYCDVFDIVEKNGQELYYCHNAGLYNNIHNKFNHKSWGLNFTGIYDAKNNTLKISGKFNGHTQEY
jgi:hypothetical protein